MSIASVLGSLGWAIIALAVAMFLPSLAALTTADYGLSWTYAASAVLTGFCGGCLVFVTRDTSKVFGKSEGYAFIVLVWVVLSLFGALPIYLADQSLLFVDAAFEAVSGLTTTGATVIQGLDAAPAPLLLWRALLQGFGGFLTVLLVVVLLSHLGVGGLDMFTSALPRGEGGTLPQRMAQTVWELAWVYAALLLLCALLLWAAGMTGFEAICHALSVLSTGGFSTRNGGIAAFDSFAVDAVVVVFMLVGATNITLLAAAGTGRWRAVRRDVELRYLYVTAFIAAVICAVLLLVHGEGPVLGLVWRGMFTGVSLLTTTAYSNGDVAGVLSPVLAVGLVLVGGMTGSTAGGLKLLRVAVLFKQSQRELQKLSHPHGVVRLRLAGRRIEDSVIRSVWSFFFVYILSIAAGATLLGGLGLDPVTAVGVVVACLNNAGPALPILAPDAPAYAEMSSAIKVTLMIAMLLGRIELLALLAVLNPAYWKR